MIRRGRGGGKGGVHRRGEERWDGNGDHDDDEKRVGLQTAAQDWGGRKERATKEQDSRILRTWLT